MSKTPSLLLWLVAVGAAGAFASQALATPKKPPKAKIVIKDCAKKKPPVTFDHAGHVAKIKKDCVTCHHKVKGKPPAADQYKCSACHAEPQGKLGTCKDISTTKNPFHKQCIECHKKEKKPAAPTKCKGCHV